MSFKCLTTSFMSIFNALCSRSGGTPQNNEEFSLASNVSYPDDDSYAFEGLPRKLGFENIKLLGQGCYGSVIVCNAAPKARQALNKMNINLPQDFLAKYIESSNPEAVAIKIAQIFSWEANKVDNFISEVEMMNDIDHPNIIKLFTGFALHCSTDEQGHKVFCAVEEYVPLLQQEDIFYGLIIMERLGPNVKQLMKDLDLDHLEEHEIRRLFLDVCDAVSYLHQQNIVHTDLHLGNIVTSLAGDNLDRAQIFTSPFKLIDFGVAYRYGFNDPGLLAQADSASALANWRDEKTFLDRNSGSLKKTIPSLFKKENGHLGRLFAKLSIKGGMVKYRHKANNLMRDFCEESILQSAKLRQAVLMLGISNVYQQITVTDALNLVRNESA